MRRPDIHVLTTKTHVRNWLVEPWLSVDHVKLRVASVAIWTDAVTPDDVSKREGRVGPKTDTWVTQFILCFQRNIRAFKEFCFVMLGETQTAYRQSRRADNRLQEPSKPHHGWELHTSCEIGLNSNLQLPLCETYKHTGFTRNSPRLDQSNLYSASDQAPLKTRRLSAETTVTVTVTVTLSQLQGNEPEPEVRLTHKHHLLQQPKCSFCLGRSRDPVVCDFVNKLGAHWVYCQSELIHVSVNSLWRGSRWCLMSSKPGITVTSPPSVHCLWDINR